MAAERPPRPTRSDFVHWSQATTRWADMDGFGHMNNARYFELIDTALDLHLQEAIGGAGHTPHHNGLFAQIGCPVFQGGGYSPPLGPGGVADHRRRPPTIY